jgi:hypothetical protein
MEANVRELFPSEKLWVTIYGAAKDVLYAITTPSEYDRREYSLYKVSNNKDPKLLGKGPDPAELERKYVKN